MTLRRDGALVVHSNWRVVVLRFYLCYLATGVFVAVMELGAGWGGAFSTNIADSLP